MRFARNFIAVLVALLLCAAMLHAGDTNFNPVFGARTFARNGLYFAGADGLSAVASNPAALGLTQNAGLVFSAIDRAGRQITEFPSRGLHRSFRANDFSLAGGGFVKLGGTAVAGVAYYRAADYQVEWPFAIFREKPGSSVVLVFDYFNKIKIDVVAPAVALQLGKFNLGLSANLYRITQNTAFPQANARWFEGVGLSAYQFEYDTDAWTFGINAGLLSQIAAKWRLGMLVKSGYRATLEGDAVSQMFADLAAAPDTVSLSGDFEMPWSFGIGVEYQHSDNLAMNLDLAYNLWGSTRERFDLQFGSPAWEAGLAERDSTTGLQGDNLPLFFNNAIEIGVGVEYARPEGLIYRAGYRFSQTPNSAATFSLLFPGVDQHWFFAGLGYAARKYTIDLALGYALGLAKDITPEENPGGFGSYESSTLVPVVSLRYHFD